MKVRQLRNILSDKNNLYFTAICFIFLFTRLYKFISLPAGMHIDEVSMGYNVWTLAKFGMDRYGVSFPVYFNNAGSGQSVIYVYMAVILSKIFGYHLWVLRIVAVLFGLMLLYFGTKTAYEIAGITCAKITAFFITIMPFFIMSERWAFDCYAFLPMFVMAFYFMIRLLKTGSWKWAVLTGIGFALTFYSYIIALIVVPVFGAVTVIYSLISRKLSFKNSCIVLGSGLVVSIPIILYCMVLVGVLPELHIGQISITAASAGRMYEIRWQGFDISEIIKNLSTLIHYDKYSFTAGDKYGVCYHHTIYLFGCKIDFLGLLLAISLLVTIGVTIYKKEFSYMMIVVIYILAGLAPMLIIEDFAIYRYNVLFYGFALILAYAGTLLWNRKCYVICGVFFLFYVYNFGSYANYLFGGGFSEDYQALEYFDYEFLELCRTVEFEKYDSVYVDSTTTYNPGLVTMYGLKMTPSEIKEQVKNLDEDGTIVRNIHIGIPAEINEGEKALYIIRDVNAKSSFYTNSYEQVELWKTLVQNNKTKQALEKIDKNPEVCNNYYMYEIDSK